MKLAFTLPLLIVFISATIVPSEPGLQIKAVGPNKVEGHKVADDGSIIDNTLEVKDNSASYSRSVKKTGEGSNYESYSTGFVSFQSGDKEKDKEQVDAVVKDWKLDIPQIKDRLQE